MTIGSRHWAIAEGYIPSPGSEDDSRFESHETACLLNTNDVEAHVTITLYFSDGEPVGPYRIIVPRGARCTCASTTWPIRNRCHAKPITPACSVPMSRSWCNTRGWIHGDQRWRC